jgi:hypothetical protein
MGLMIEAHRRGFPTVVRKLWRNSVAGEPGTFRSTPPRNTQGAKRFGQNVQTALLTALTRAGARKARILRHRF